MTEKLDSPEFRSLFSEQLRELARLFDEHSHELRLAGGAVRDLRMGRRPHDLDFATTATPDEMVRMFESAGVRMINANGLAHGTVTVRINDKENFEVTTLRVDRETDGRHAKVEFTKDWQLDASRRDLTINSMFLGLDGRLYDYFGGVADLEARRVRFVGDAGERIREDYLRILRYFRFFGRIAERADSHEEATLRAIVDNADGLAGIAGERLWTELKQILVGRFAPSILQVVADCGVARHLGLPARPDVHEFRRVRPDDGDGEASAESPPHHAACLAALLPTRQEAEAAHARLRLSNEELGVLRFVQEHREEARQRPRQLEYFQDLVMLNPAKEARVKDKTRQLLVYCRHWQALADFDAWQPPPFPVNGREIVQAWGLDLRGRGPALGAIIHHLRLEWSRGRYAAGKEELLADSVRDRVLEKVGLASEQPPTKQGKVC